MRVQTRRLPVTTSSSLFAAVALAGVATMVSSGTARERAALRAAGDGALSAAGEAALSDAGAVTLALVAALSLAVARPPPSTGPEGSGSESYVSLEAVCACSWLGEKDFQAK